MSPKGGKKKKPKKKQTNTEERAHTRSLGPPPDVTEIIANTQGGDASNNRNEMAPEVIDIIDPSAVNNDADPSAVNNDAIASDEEAFEETKEELANETAEDETTVDVEQAIGSEVDVDAVSPSRR